MVGGTWRQLAGSNETARAQVAVTGIRFDSSVAINADDDLVERSIREGVPDAGGLHPRDGARLGMLESVDERR